VPYPGKPSCSAGWYGRRKPSRKGRPPRGEGAEGGRSADRTDDSGPVKPGNSVEDKTLTTEKQGSREGAARRPASGKTRAPRSTPSGCGKSRTKGEDDHVEEPKGWTEEPANREGVVLATGSGQRPPSPAILGGREVMEEVK